MTTPDPHAGSKTNGANASAPANVRATTVQASDEWWQQLDQRIYQCIKLWVEQWYPPQQRGLIDAVGDVFGEEHHNQREAIAKIKDRVLVLETTNSFEERFNKLTNEVKRGSELPQSELPARIDGLQRQLDVLKRVADLDARFRELAERVGELEKTNSLEARFTKLANDAKRGSELPQSELLVKIDGLQRQLDDLKEVAGQPGPTGTARQAAAGQRISCRARALRRRRRHA